MIKEFKTRRSIRKYMNKPVEDEKIKELIESARLAPSGNNTQPWNFIIVKSDSGRQKLTVASNNQDWMLSAPVFIVAVADIRCRVDNNTSVWLDENSPQKELKQIIRDTAISIEHILLEADSVGLGTCWVGDFTQEKIRPLLNIPDDKYVVGIVTVGYADEAPNPRPRKKLEDIIHYENW